jgi:hypothetical protein
MLLRRGVVFSNIVVGVSLGWGQAGTAPPQAPPTARPSSRSSPTPPKNAAGPAVAHYISGPVPLDTTVLGAHFLGHDIRAVTSRIEASPLSKPKSEFETTAQYAVRMTAFREKDFQYVFVIPSPTDVEGNDQQFRYDADRQILTSSVSFAGERIPEVAGLPDHYFLMIRADATGTKHYVGVNAFGVEGT